MRCLQVKDGVIVNVIVADPTFDPGDGSQIVASDVGNPGDLYVAGVITSAPITQAPLENPDLWHDLWLAAPK